VLAVCHLRCVEKTAILSVCIAQFARFMKKFDGNGKLVITKATFGFC